MTSGSVTLNSDAFMTARLAAFDPPSGTNWTLAPAPGPIGPNVYADGIPVNSTRNGPAAVAVLTVYCPEAFVTAVPATAPFAPNTVTVTPATGWSVGTGVLPVPVKFGIVPVVSYTPLPLKSWKTMPLTCPAGTTRSSSWV